LGWAQLYSSVLE